ncbi:NACHT, LRR and PYD domains-containing protein 3-like [Lithobates pipiens]
MGTFFSKTPSQGSASGVLGRVPQTPGDLIVYSLEDLKGSDFKRFRNKLSDFYNEDKLPIPRGKLENADWITTKDLLIHTYGEEGALDVTIDVLTVIGLMGPANDLQERREQNANLKKMTHDNRSSDFRKEYRGSAKQKFQRITHYNSCMGEAVHLQKRFTTILMRKAPQNKKGKEYEISGLDRRQIQIIEKRQDEYSPITIQTLFDPDENGLIPKIVVLEGPAGIGKTMTSKKIMLDWASGDLYQDKFDFVFYLNCREINTFPENISLVGLLSRTCRLSSDDLVSILKDPESQRKLLTIVDGFDELRWSPEEKSEGCLDISMETHKEIILQSLLRGQVLPESSLIITTRSLAMEKLNTFIDDSRNVEILGFTREAREEYVHKFYANKEDADKVLSIIKENEVVYTMCAVPITCWVVCTAMKQEIRKDLDVIQCITMTSIYLLYLEVLLTHHSKKEQSVHRKQTCLKKLCALANRGVLNQQILFEKKDLERRGISLDEVESVFLNENIFRTETRYSFIHLSVQEFLAALYYVLDDGFGFMKGAFLPEICKGKSFGDVWRGFVHLTLAVQFLFGFLHEKPLKTFSETTGINISLRARATMIKWAMKDIIQAFYIPTISCLYETQDENFIRRVMSHCSSLKLHGSPIAHFWQNRNYCKQLRYCLKTLTRENVQSLEVHRHLVDPECQKVLSPLIHSCQKVKFWGCIISSKDCPEEEEAKYEDGIKSDTLSFLMNPESKIQELWLDRCDLNSSGCDDLRSILINNQSLTRLDILYNNLEDSGIKLLCEGLRHPGCTLQWLNVNCGNWTLSCCNDLCSVIPTNQTLTWLRMLLYGAEKISDSETDRCCEVLRDAGFTVERGIRSFWIASINRRR